LDLFGDFYRRPQKEGNALLEANNGEFSYMVNYDGTLADHENFLEQLNEYFSRCMGSKDIYCCPLCYAEAHRRFQNTKQEVDSDSEQDLSDDEHEFPQNDPIQVLGSLDNDSFKLASTFCFRKLVQVKKHLQKDHAIDTSVLDGNDLFQRFMVSRPKCIFASFARIVNGYS
jgi:hypothetical protein